jgi:hypothetical protein
VLSFLTLEAAALFRWTRLGIGRWIACRTEDYGPALFLISSVVFLWSFRPFAAILAEYRASEVGNLEGMGLFWELFSIGNVTPARFFYEPYHEWLAVTIGLAGIAGIMVLRDFLRRVDE